MRWSRRKREKKKKAQQRRMIRKTAIIAGAAALTLAALDGIYVKVMARHFYHHTTLNGYNVSGKTAAQVTNLLAQPYSQLGLQITEEGETVLSSTLPQIGYSVDREAMQASIEELIDRQNGLVFPGLLLGNHCGMRVPFQIDDSLFQATVSQEQLSKPRVPTANAELVEKDGTYVIQPEVYGTDFENTDLRSLVNEAITRSLSDGKTESTITVAIPDSLYQKPEILADNPDLLTLEGIYNRFCDAQVTYLFGEQTQVLGWDTIRQWLHTEQPASPLDEDAVYQYVAELADTYDTYRRPRTFESTLYGPITIDYNNYGYAVDVDAEAAQLVSDLYANAPVEREPIYWQEGFSRNGVDDLNGTYVEVDLSSQYLWFYKHGDLVVETPIISGLPTPERATHEGVFTIPYKQSPATLKGQGGGPGEDWDVEVQYWMPFDDGQGLHDATWQSAFGGSTYQYAGSHGCINLSLDAAAAIYNAMEENVAILIYS